MAEQQHPITPPPELFAEWVASSLKTLGRKIPEDDRGTTGLIAAEVAIHAVHWGADRELEACIDAILAHPGFESPELFVELLRAARRPKPLSLVRRALHILGTHGDLSPKEHDTIRQALEHLDD